MSKWILGVLAVMTALAGLFNQWVSDRVSTLQATQRIAAQKKFEDAETELQKTKTRTAQLEEKLAPRLLSIEKKAAITEAVRPHSGTKFQVASYQDDAEVKALVMALLPALLEARWEGIPAQEFLMAALVEGVVVEYAPGSTKALASAANALTSSLNANGVVAIARQTEELKDRTDRIRIKVGKKPTK